jgi:hypothetical protein
VPADAVTRTGTTAVPPAGSFAAPEPGVTLSPAGALTCQRTGPAACWPDGACSTSATAVVRPGATVTASGRPASTGLVPDGAAADPATSPPTESLSMLSVVPPQVSLWPP